MIGGCREILRGRKGIKLPAALRRCFTFAAFLKTLIFKQKIVCTMKNMVFVLLGSVLFLVGACREVDKELVGKAESEITKIDQALPEVESAAERSGELLKQMDAMPNGLKFNPKYNFSELHEMAKSITMKYKTIATMEQQAKQSLDSLITVYSNGDIKKEDFVVEYEKIVASIESLSQTPARIQPVFEELTANFTKLSAEYQALPEAERVQIEKQMLSTEAPGTPATSLDKNN